MAQEKVLGTIEFTEREMKLVEEFSQTILGGTFEQAYQAFTIIFERSPENNREMAIFKEICKEKIGLQ